jgi:long-chain acyl-CoA synthetase
MNFLDSIFNRLRQSASAPVLVEIHDARTVPATGDELLSLVAQARAFLAARGLKRGDRCALLAPNSIRWVALDLALTAEGIIVVPLYSRQAPHELVVMMKDASPARIFCADAPSAAEIQKLWPAAPPITLLDAVFVPLEKDAADDAAREANAGSSVPSLHLADSDPVTVIYTSGTSGEAKGVVLTAGNIGFMLGCTNTRLDELMALSGAPKDDPDRIFQYGPFSLAASWMLLLTALSRRSVLYLSTNVSMLSNEIKVAAPNYFLNVPLVLERVRAKVEEMIRKRGRLAATVFTRAQSAYRRRFEKGAAGAGAAWLALANFAMFPSIRKGIGPNLKALICGSAPLSVETQLFYGMLGIPVLQAYGLTETTAICTLDDPANPVPSCVGLAVPGIEMKVGENSEILVRGPNVFPGYWNRPHETAQVLRDGWFHTGDQGEMDAGGHWRITGRIKNLLVLSSGHNVAPEPLEDALAASLPEAQHVVLIGNQRASLAALLTPAAANSLQEAAVQSAINAMNAELPHYKRIRAFRILSEAFSVENGLLTMNGKLKRAEIASRFASEIDALYATPAEPKAGKASA